MYQQEIQTELIIEGINNIHKIIQQFIDHLQRTNYNGGFMKITNQLYFQTNQIITKLNQILNLQDSIHELIKDEKQKKSQLNEMLIKSLNNSTNEESPKSSQIEIDLYDTKLILDSEYQFYPFQSQIVKEQDNNFSNEICLKSQSFFKKRGKYQSYSQYEKEQIIELAKTYSLNKISCEKGIPPTTIKRWIKLGPIKKKEIIKEQEEKFLINNWKRNQLNGINYNKKTIRKQTNYNYKIRLNNFVIIKISKLLEVGSIILFEEI